LVNEHQHASIGVLVGGTGTGKTLLAIAIARSCIRCSAPHRFSHRLLKLEHKIVDRRCRPVTREVVRVVWASPEVAFGDDTEAGRGDFLA
jgi:hypothetical protein